MFLPGGETIVQTDLLFLEMIISIILILTFAIALVVMTLISMWNLILVIYTGFARRGIGSWDDRDSWRDAVKAKARKWLCRAPAVLWADRGLFGIVKGRLSSRKPNTWQTAGLLMGLDDEDVQDIADSRRDLFSGQVLSKDNGLLAFSLKERGLLKAEDEKRLLSGMDRYLESGTIPFSSERQDSRQVETIGLICPFLYSTGLGELADRQIDEYDKALFNNVFPYHGFDITTGLPLGAHDWGRGTGLYILGLVESGHYEGKILGLAENMLRLQRTDGAFGCFLFDKHSSRDSFTTVFAGLLFVSAYRLSGEDRFLDAARAVEKALMSMTRKNGTVDYAQADSKGIGFYPASFEPMPFVQGMTVRFSKELDKAGASARS